MFDVRRLGQPFLNATYLGLVPLYVSTDPTAGLKVGGNLHMTPEVSRLAALPSIIGVEPITGTIIY